MFIPNRFDCRVHSPIFHSDPWPWLTRGARRLHTLRRSHRPLTALLPFSPWTLEHSLIHPLRISSSLIITHDQVHSFLKLTYKLNCHNIKGIVAFLSPHLLATQPVN